jgi:hypothetical protein
MLMLGIQDFAKPGINLAYLNIPLTLRGIKGVYGRGIHS